MAQGQVLPSIIPVEIWRNFVFFNGINPVNWKSRALPVHFPLYPFPFSTSAYNDFHHKRFGDILYSRRFININAVIPCTMWDTSQVVCLEWARLSSVDTASMANPRQLEFMRCRDFRGRQHQVFTCSCRSKTVLLQHRVWSHRLSSCSLQGNFLSRIFKDGGRCALPLALLPHLPSLGPSCSSVFSPSGLFLSSLYRSSPCSPNLSRSFLYPLLFLCPLEKARFLYMFSGCEEEKFSVDACVITSHFRKHSLEKLL